MLPHCRHTIRDLFHAPRVGYVNVIRCRYSSLGASDLILHIPSAAIYRFSASDAAKPALHVDWTIRDGESWSIIGNASEEKSLLLDTLKGHTRVKPAPPKGVWPFLYRQGLDPVEHVRTVSFAHRPRSFKEGFYDYSARYGAVREGDTLSLRKYLSDSAGSGNFTEEAVVSLAVALELQQLLDLPLVALSNGQTRRARIAKALLRRPQVLVLDEPLTGLDKHHRPRLMALLYNLHKNNAPRIILTIRTQDPLPDWITHVALLQPNGHVVTGQKSTVLTNYEKPVDTTRTNQAIYDQQHVSDPRRAVLVDLRAVNVSYHDRHVQFFSSDDIALSDLLITKKILRDINWTIREGERWILQGPNGSGKTTLLSMITGDHPQSYTQPHLYLFGTPRNRLATPAIARRIGICSPEIYNAFPRRSGANALSVRDAIVSGFDGVFTYRKPTAEQSKRVDSLLADLGPTAWSDNTNLSSAEDFGKRKFTDLTTGEQSLVMLLRAIVNNPELLILDEAFSGMDLRMVDVTKRYLREHLGEKQAIIWVSHWESEAPWDAQDRVLIYSLECGLER